MLQECPILYIPHPEPVFVEKGLPSHTVTNPTQQWKLSSYRGEPAIVFSTMPDIHMHDYRVIDQSSQDKSRISEFVCFLSIGSQCAIHLWTHSAKRALNIYVGGCSMKCSTKWYQFNYNIMCIVFGEYC